MGQSIDNSALGSEQAVAGRIAEVIKQLGGLTKAANMTGISRSLLARYRNRESDPSFSKLVQISEASGVDLSWLTTGQSSVSQSGHHMITLYSNLVNNRSLKPINKIAIPDQLLPLSRPRYQKIKADTLYAMEIMAPNNFGAGQRPITVITERVQAIETSGPYAISINNHIVFRMAEHHKYGCKLYAPPDIEKASEMLDWEGMQIVPFMGRIIWAGTEY